MPDFLAARIRDRLGDDVSAQTAALLAVVDKCEQMRADAEQNAVGNTFWAHAITNEFEQVIARALNIPGRPDAASTQEIES
jgi:hypothetical protein